MYNMIIRIHPSPIPQPRLPCGLLSEHADTFLTCKFWTCKPFSFDLQVFEQTIEQSCVSLGCCLKHSLSCECFTTNLASRNIFYSEMQENHTIHSTSLETKTEPKYFKQQPSVGH